MSKGTSIALLVIGLVLTGYGLSASDSFGSSVSRLFTGAPTDKTVWLLIGGVAALIIGVFGLLRGAK